MFCSVAQGHPVTLLINFLFMCLAVFHLAYLGQMFLSDPDSEEFDYQVGVAWGWGSGAERWILEGRVRRDTDVNVQDVIFC